MGGRSPVIVAGAGIAGLATALALADRGLEVRILERSARPVEAGAGLQLSPNATRILRRIGVLERLGKAAFMPEAVMLRDAATGRTIAELPLGARAERRWGAPYLVAHRADLHAALLEGVLEERAAALRTSADVIGARRDRDGVCVEFLGGERSESLHGEALVAADGVWSTLRRHVRGEHASRFSGHIAWRAMLDASDPAVRAIRADRVNVFLDRRFHLVAYPLRAGTSINLVAVTSGKPLAERWASDAEAMPLAGAMAGTAVADVAGAARWTVWPLHVVDASGAWSHEDGIVLVGDAAHAMTPFAAQGAAMAIEDAWILADCLAQDGRGPIQDAFARYAALRKPRVARVVQRAAFNRFAWHASGPVAFARNIVLSARNGEPLMRDLDWLYGYDAAAAVPQP